MIHIPKTLQHKITVLIVTIITFSIVYTQLGKEHWSGMDDNIDENTKHPFLQKLLNRFYFTMTTTSTVGYGDIHPVSNIARCIVMLNMILVSIESLSILHDVIRL